MTTRPTTESINLYTDALLRWLKAGRDYPTLANPELVADGVPESEAEAVKITVVQDFERKV